MVHFDSARIRHNFERACGPLEPALPERLVAVSAPRDPLPEARRLLASVRAACERRYPAKWSLIEPFFREAERLLSELESAGRLRAPGAEENPSPPSAPEKTRAALAAVLCEIEDLLEVIAEVGFG